MPVFIHGGGGSSDFSIMTEFITTSGPVIVPTNAYKCDIHLWGGGASSRGAYSLGWWTYIYYMGASLGGSSSIQYGLEVTPGTSYNAIIGEGGIPQSKMSLTRLPGGQTSFMGYSAEGGMDTDPSITGIDNARVLFDENRGLSVGGSGVVLSYYTTSVPGYIPSTPMLERQVQAGGQLSIIVSNSSAPIAMLPRANSGGGAAIALTDQDTYGSAYPGAAGGICIRWYIAN